ncbi:reverse transcriptase domain-containing protein [Tanacetum coccineum]
MASKAVASRVEIETKQDIGEVESKQVMSAKAPASGDHMFVGIEVKQDMSATIADIKTDLFLDQLQVDVTGIGNAIHCTARSNVAHNFIRLKEGGIYSIKNFVVHRNKEEYRIRKKDGFMFEFDGATSIRKAFVKADGFVCYPFQLVDFDGIEPIESKYLIGGFYITNVSRTNHQKTSSHNLDFYLANHRVTLWGALWDVMIEKKSKQADKLYLSSSSSAMIFDDADIPAVKALITNMPASGEESKKLSVSVDHFALREGTLENLLMWARNRKNDVRIANVRTRKGWNFPSHGGENCKKGSTRKLGQFWCEFFNKCVEFTVLSIHNPFVRIYKLELDITDDTANAVVVMFDEPATTLVGCSEESVMEDDDESSDDQSNLPPALANLIGTTHTLEIKSHTYYEYRTFESFTCWTIVLTEGVMKTASFSTLDTEAATENPKLKRLTRDPSVPTPSKPSEERQTKRVDIEDSDSKDRGDTDMHVVDKKKRGTFTLLVTPPIRVAAE